MSQTSLITQPSPFAVFRNPSFTKLWTAQLISTIGDAFTMLAAGIYIYRITGSAMQVGLMLIATSVPTLLIGMFAGVFVDRYDRKRIMIAADLLRAVLIFLIPILIPYSVVWLYVIVMLTSAISTFFAPAFDSVLPETANDEDLAAANSMIAISSFGSTAIGFAASGLIASVSIELAFYIDALTFVVSALLINRVKISPLQNTEETTVKNVVGNLKVGVKFLFDTPVLRSIFLIGIPIWLGTGLWNTLLLPFAEQVLGATEFEYGLQEGLTSIGFVIGSLLLARYVSRLREGQWIIISLIGWGLVAITYALSSSLFIAIALVTVSGFINAPWGVARRTMIQRNTDREIRGRVFGAFMTVSHVILLIGMGAAGLADILGVRVMMMVAALISLVGGGIALFAPDIGRPAAEWVRSISLLRRAAQAPSLDMGRIATLADFDRLVGHLPALSILSTEDRISLLQEMRYIEAPLGTAIVRHGETSDAAYFIIAGKAIAGREENGQERILEVLNPGDFFGEIAALTGIPRTANVVTEESTAMLRVSASTLGEMSKNPDLNRILISKMTERMVRMNMIDLPKLISYDQRVLRELRTEAPEQFEQVELQVA
ncbi:MAG TPA: MFS transporter [Anaerolineales bacterium]|nr:MFS transporter [Anaerolineales bacterium]